MNFNGKNLDDIIYNNPYYSNSSLHIRSVVLPAFAQTGTGSQGQEESSDESQVTNRTFFEFNTGIPAFNVTLFPPDQFS